MNKTTKAKLIALDIDGTILDKGEDIPVPAAVRDAVRDARASGARACLCSSRPCYFMEDATRGLGEIDALIGCSGAMIEIGGELVYMDRLPLSLLSAVLEMAKKWDLYVSFAGKTKLLVSKKGSVNPSEDIDHVFLMLQEKELLERLRTEPVSCAFLFKNPDMPDHVILEEPSLAAATIHHSGHGSFTITDQGTDKGTGLLRLAKRWGIPREATLAVGNDANDIPMLKIAGIGAAVANASPAVLAAADVICPSVSEAGAAEAIRRYALGKR